MSAVATVSSWGEFVVEEGRTAYWRIGPLQLWASNLEREWQLHHHQDPDPLSQEAATEVPSDTPVAAGATRLRFSFERSGTRLSLTPVLADRAIVVKPETALYIPGGEASTLFISTPLWVRLALEQAGQLAELPSYRPSDTWFGPSPVEGEFCYATRTAARLSPEELSFRPHRAVTPLRITNRADEALYFEKVKLPVQYLSVYRSATGGLWTEGVTLKREDAGELAALDIRPRPPSLAGSVTKLSGPRQHGGRNLMVRAFSKFFRHE